ncbi:hypothetical protein MQE36_01880 [Zhouia spongiae]|uniref:Anti-sigma factor n=1 Tax=Zhouia spongiae TaxID=2202721 RepID=A0ABY3YPP3_9FLAO|nr:hypothetical protein [Zhouia spongiae]UNY99108.1 hypothetical protein MQE36_01880 [Zhouia spongiae]
MKSNYLDKYIKRKLEERKVEPGPDAWDRLSEMLDEENEVVKPKKMLVHWVAALMVLAVVSSVYLFRSGKDREPVEVVETTKEEPVLINDDLLIEDDHKEGEAIVGIENKEKELSVERTNKISKKRKSSFKKPGVSTDERIVEVQYEKTREEKKVDEVVSKIAALSEKREVTDAEVEALLLQAQKDLYENTIIKSPDSLSAMVLLSEVETALDQSFKEKVFEALKESFIKVKTAVAERNQ